jgi:hypothetical protein
MKTGYYTISLDLSIDFKPAFAGLKSVYMYAADTMGAASGWQTTGTWTSLATTATAASVTPNDFYSLQPYVSHLQFVFADSRGFADLNFVGIIIGDSLRSNGTCFVRYNQGSRTIYLMNDAATAWVGSRVVDSPSDPLPPLANSQCTIVASATGGGKNLVLALSVWFTPAFDGMKNIYMFAADGSGTATGWQHKGTFGVDIPNQPPLPMSVTPNSGTGSNQTFGFTVTEGSQHLHSVSMSIGAVMHDPRCSFTYWPETNEISLAAGWTSGWSGYRVLGLPGIVENPWCSIDPTVSSVSVVGNDVTISVALTFKAAFAGTHNIFVDAIDTAGGESWPLFQGSLGTWVVP